MSLSHRRLEALEEVLAELVEVVAIPAAQHICVLTQHFEGNCSFEGESFARHVGEEEAEVNVEYVALFVEEDVAVVSVFDLQEVADQTRRSQRLAEVETGLLQLFLLPVLVLEHLQE